MTHTVLKTAALLAALAALPVLAQYKPGPGEEPTPAAGLSAKDIQQIQSSLTMTPSLQAAQNALADHAISDLVIDHKKAIAKDDLFTHVIKNPGSITNQERSGRCWLFAGLNILRPEVMNKFNMKDFTLSQAYEDFWDKVERANRALDLAVALSNEPLDSRKNMHLLKSPMDDGGDWNYVLALIDKYGVVPQNVMPDTYSASHTGQMNKLLGTEVRKGVLALRAASREGASAEKMQQIKMKTLDHVYKILVLCMGEPPQSFQWRYTGKDGKVSPLRTYTPQSFYKEFVGNDLHNYERFVNYPGKPMHQRLQWAWDRDMADQPDLTAVNVTSEELTEMAKASVLADQPVWFASDAGAQGDRKAGLWAEGVEDYDALFGLSLSMDKKDYLETGAGAPDHAMVFVGVDIQNGVPDKWKVENSWGKKAGDEGFFTIDKGWFDRNVYEIIVNKRFVPPELQKLTDQKPYILPPWDPFGA
ncbi:MAG: C1 family peptidase [Acidobacteriota bacterium]